MKKNNFWGFFQSLGKTFMLPVSLLAACGILLGVGSGFTNPALYKTVPFLGYPAVKLFFQFMTTVGLFAFVNLPVMFAIAIPLGLAEKNKGVAAFSGYVGFSMTALAGNFFLKATGTLATPENMKAAGQAMVLGIQSVDVGVLGGVVIGIIVYKIHERFCESVLPDAFAFFGGARFVPIMTTLFFGFFGLIVPIVWPFFNGLIMQIGNLIGKAGVFGPFIFGAGEALLRPFGLHHILVAMIRFTSAGGTEVINGEAVHGALNIFYQYFADGVLNADATRFLSQGKMPTYIFGLPGVALAMYQTARPENKKKIKGLLISGVVACVVGGITEPLEFIFLFLAPVLYLFHVVMVGLGFMVMALLHVAIGNTDGNIIDFLVFGLLQGNQTKWYAIVDKSIFQVYQMQMTEMPNASDTSVQLHSPDLSNANTENGNSHSPNLSNEYKETDNKQQIVNLQIGESNSKLEITREEKNSHTQNSENENLAKSENNFSVDNFVDEKNQHTPTQENQKQSRYVREYFWMTASDKSKLEDDYFKSEIDDYVDRYNSWVKTSGKESRCPVETIRKWMLEDGARKRPSKEQRRLDEIVRLANFPRWEWESDESFYERIRRYDKAGLPPHYNGTIRKWKDADVKAQAIQIDRAVRAEYFGEGF